LRCRQCNNIVLNVHAPNNEKSDDLKDRFYEELEDGFDHSPKQHIKFCQVISMQKWGERIFSNRQLRKRVHIRIIMMLA
jgi:hypothetical protein